ncbi:hypothetical protein TNCV_637371 [Trichonephila clavipes]|nr:hypothetical protein TNCV_637371 [Trichonephila clavipes]
MTFGFSRNDCERGRSIAESSKGDGYGQDDPLYQSFLHSQNFAYNFGYNLVCAMWVPKVLMEDNKRKRAGAANEFLQVYETFGKQILDYNVTGDKA